MTIRESEPRVLLLGPLPDPANGMTVFTKMVLETGLPGVRVHHLDTSDHRPVGNIGRFDLANAWLASRHLATLAMDLVRTRPDLVYLPIAQGRLGYLRDGLFLVLARLAGVRAVVHLHGSALATFYRTTDRLTRAFLRSTLSRVSRAIVLSPTLAGEFRPFLPPERIAVVENAVRDPGRPRPRDPSSSGPIHVGSIGMLSRAKGTHALLEAALLSLEEAPELRFILAGDWDTPRDKRIGTEILARRPDLSRRIEFPGVVSGVEKDHFFANLDLFVFCPREREGQPLVLLEAMSWGLPIVTRTIGAIPETVPAPRHALHVDGTDSVAIARALVTLAQDPGARSEMGRANRERYESRYTPRACVDRLGSVLGEAASLGRRPFGRISPLLEERA